MADDWRSLDAARAALADPRTAPHQLLAICIAQPNLAAEAAMHAAADRNLLAWLAKWEDPITAATAQARLTRLPADAPNPGPAGPTPVVAPAQPTSTAAARSAAASGAVFAGAPAHPSPAASPGVQSTGRGPSRKVVIGGIAAVLALALVATGVFVVLPWLTGRGGTYDYAPDFRELPGILAVDPTEGLPTSGDDSWSTTFTAVPGTGIALAHNWNSAFSDYRERQDAYEAATQAYREWESAYASGYTDGKSCLTASVDLTWYTSKQEYCSYNRSDYSSTSSTAGEAGFTDAIASLPSTPASPGSGLYEPPEVPAKPQPPTMGDNLAGIDLKTGKIAWRLDLGSVWPGVTPSASQSNTDAGRTLLLLSDPAADEDAPERMLVVVDDRTGKATAGKSVDGAEVAWATLAGEVVVVSDENANLRALKTADLTTEIWRASARALGAGGEENPYWLTPPPGYLLTQDGYLRIADGVAADFARDAGQDGIQLTVLSGTQNDLIRVESRDGTYDVAGFNSGSNTSTWRLDGLTSLPRGAGGQVVATEGDEVTAYRINGSSLERTWRYSCTENCFVAFADDDRVFVEDLGGKEIAILKTGDGTKLDRVRDENGNYPTVGRSVVYLQTQNRIVAYDLDKSGIPTLWRSREIGGWLQVFDGSLAIVDGSSGRLGIIGLGGDDWSSFRPTQE